MYYDNKGYQNAMTKEEACEAANLGNIGGNGILVKVINLSNQILFEV